MKKTAKKGTKSGAKEKSTPKKSTGGMQVVKTELVEVPAYSYRRKITAKQQAARELFVKNYGNTPKKRGKKK